MPNNVHIWKWDNTSYLIETNEPKITAQIRKWNFAKDGPSFGVNHYRRQFLIPKPKVRLACKLLGITLDKNPNRVRAGQQAATNHPISRGRR